ncbi:hypothetical protein ACSYDW_08815 [Paeniglutamicibacter sp. R2-26]|uniref:hypothetical protein n=1 Tax=Paeniglutamicibacter sp. R2-26 TaxID=3144417 RepID=UPI003EE58393
MGIHQLSPGRYHVQPFGVAGRSWPLTAEEITRVVIHAAVSCLAVAMATAGMFAYVAPGSAATGMLRFFTFILLLLPALHLVHHLLRPPDAEIARRWEHILSHPEEYPYEPTPTA